ncbi:MAG: hypothetical protein IH962_03175 [Chloroflexi bacterium]|nr:hypothetical protein [Chloroflexota bacterium]
MARISISIPDRLMARLEPVKERINISQLCREALERRITTFERAAVQSGRELDTDSLVERLREERAVDGGKFEELGRSNAAGWMSTASYLEFRVVADDIRSTNMRNYRLPRVAFGTMKRDMENLSASLDGVQAIAYKTAWLDSVRAVWAQIVDQLEPEDSSGTSADPERNQL